MAAAFNLGGLTSFGEKTSNGTENWQDANAALAELDKGLRSSKTGEQCEAIVRFPSLFEKYPLPILINSALLKLADIFRIGSNFLRLCILKVMQQSEKHLNKILNVDEFLKRIYSVIYSNDPVARANTVRVLGSIASIIPERKNVHHSIRSSLESHDEVELEAAIFATDRFCAQSREFASGLFNKLSNLIKGLSTPVDMKLKLIPIFRHMHFDVKLTSKVRDLCSSLLVSQPACHFTVTTLHTLSCLAVSSVIDIPNQAHLLLEYLKGDPRKVVKKHTLSDLTMLAKEAPHMWQLQHRETLCDFILGTCHDDLKFAALRALVTLSRSMIVDLLNNKVLEVCRGDTNSPITAVAASATELFVNIAAAGIQSGKGDPTLCEEAAVALETCTVVCCVARQLQPLKVCLSSINHLIVHYHQAASPLMETLSSILPSSSGPIALALCHAMVTIATQIPSVLAKLRTEILSHFSNVVVTSDEDSHETRDLLVGVVTLIFQSHQFESFDEDRSLQRKSVGNLILEHLRKLTVQSRYWIMFRVGRQATRTGFHGIAAKIFENLSSKVASEQFYFWLNALKFFCEAESLLSVPCDSQLALDKQISEAYAKYHKGLNMLKASVSPNPQLSFQCTYARLRTEMIQVHSMLLASCATMKSCPPPAIATAVAMATGQGVHTLSHFAVQMAECSKVFRGLGESYGKLYYSSFNADPVSLQNIDTLQQSCVLISHSIDVLMKTTQPSSLGEEQNRRTKKTSAVKQSELSLACTEILETVENLAVQLEALPVCHLQTECLLRASMTLLKVPFVFPKFFFGSQQATFVKLALSPSPRTPSDHLTVTLDTQFILKVEGVIEHGPHPGLYRDVQSVCLSVTWRTEEKKPQSLEGKSPRDNVTSLEQTVVPHNDYFSAQFLLSFTSLALHHVTVRASVIDSSGIQWDTGPQNSLQVKTLETMSRKQRTSRT